MTIPDSDLEQWQQACDAATPEPWELWDNRGIQCREPVHWTFGPGGWRPDKWRDVGDPLSGYSNQGVNINGLNGVRAPEDCAFVATARTAMPRLIAEVRMLQQRIGELERRDRWHIDRLNHAAAQQERLRQQLARPGHHDVDDLYEEATP